MNLDIKNKKISIQVLLTFMLSIILILTGLAFAFYFRGNTIDIITTEMQNEAKVLSKVLACTSKFDSIKKNTSALKEIADEMLNEKGVVFVAITDSAGNELASQKKGNNKDINIPQKINSMSESDSAGVAFEFNDKTYIIASSPIMIDEAFLKKFGLASYSSTIGSNGYTKVVLSLDHALEEISNTTSMIILFISIITVVGIIFSIKKLIHYKPINYSITYYMT